MLQPCSNTEAEIINDQPIYLTKEELEESHLATAILREKRAEFIDKLMRNEGVAISIYSAGHYFLNVYSLSDAISTIESNEFWAFNPNKQEYANIDEWFHDDVETLCEAIARGEFPQFNDLIKYQVQQLSDCVRF